MPEPTSYAVRDGRGSSDSGRSTGPVGPGSSSPPTPAREGGASGATATPSSVTRRHGRPGVRAHVKDGTRYGRSAARPVTAGAVIRRDLLRLALTPSLAVTVVAVVVVAYLLLAGPTAGEAGAGVWLVLGSASVLVCGAVAWGVLLATAQARGTVDRYTSLRRHTARHQAELQALLRRLEQGERPRRASHGPLPEATPDDAFALLAREVTAAARVAEATIVESAALARGRSTGNEEKVEVFVNLSRRLQSLVHREIELLDELENQVEDPDLLKGLFHVDHLATRIRRHAENLAVLGGAVSRRQWTRPVTMTEVLRSASAEVEQYPRVKLVPPIEGELRGHAVADVIHLLAELIENASVFSAPQTQVLLRAQYVTAGLAVEVEDRGLGMTTGEQNRMNTLLSEPERVNVQDLLRDGRIGLFVVSQLARRHGIVVQLQSNIYGGVQAVLILPRAMLGEAPGQREDAGQSGEPARDEPGERHANPLEAPTSDGPVTTERPEGQRPTPLADQPQIPGQQRGVAHSRAASEQSGDETHPGPDSAPSRPRLPRRRRQQHLMPELRTPPPGRADSEAFDSHDPGLMAAFRRGTSLADDPDADTPPTPNTGGPAPYSGF